MDLLSVINKCLSHLSQEWRNKYSLFLENEHWDLFSRKLVNFLESGNKETSFLPYFNEELIPSKQEIHNCFNEVLSITKEGSLEEIMLQKKWAKSIEQTPFEYLLIIYGQRLTPASLQNEEAIPPLKSTLLKSSFVPFNEQICIATRAWEKHIGRSEDNFWGTIKGSPKEKEEKVKTLITNMLENQTWWNIFHHYKHGLVYEIRVPSGHGIRWNKEGTELIGFLEPFLNEES